MREPLAANRQPLFTNQQSPITTPQSLFRSHRSRNSVVSLLEPGHLNCLELPFIR